MAPIYRRRSRDQAVTPGTEQVGSRQSRVQRTAMASTTGQHDNTASPAPQRGGPSKCFGRYACDLCGSVFLPFRFHFPSSRHAEPTRSPRVLSRLTDAPLRGMFLPYVLRQVNDPSQQLRHLPRMPALQDRVCPPHLCTHRT